MEEGSEENQRHTQSQPDFPPHFTTSQQATIKNRHADHFTQLRGPGVWNAQKETAHCNNITREFRITEYYFRQNSHYVYINKTLTSLSVGHFKWDKKNSRNGFNLIIFCFYSLKELATSRNVRTLN